MWQVGTLCALHLRLQIHEPAAASESHQRSHGDRSGNNTPDDAGRQATTYAATLACHRRRDERTLDLQSYTFISGSRAATAADTAYYGAWRESGRRYLPRTGWASGLISTFLTFKCWHNMASLAFRELSVSHCPIICYIIYPVERVHSFVMSNSLRLTS